MEKTVSSTNHQEVQTHLDTKREEHLATIPSSRSQTSGSNHANNRTKI